MKERWQGQSFTSVLDNVLNMLTAWSTKVLSAFCQPVTKGHNCHIDFCQLYSFVMDERHVLNTFVLQAVDVQQGNDWEFLCSYIHKQILSIDEHKTRNCNSGTNKQPLDVFRMNAIRDEVFKMMTCTLSDKDKLWKVCITSMDAMNRKNHGQLIIRKMVCDKNVSFAINNYTY